MSLENAFRLDKPGPQGTLVPKRKSTALVSFSEPLPNDLLGTNATHKIEMRTANGEAIGVIYFRLPTSADSRKMVTIVKVGVDPRYRGSLGVKLYEQVMQEAHQMNMRGICSDSIVQDGAVITWKRLQEKYKVTVHNAVLADYNAFIARYNSRKYEHQVLRVPPFQSVFTLEFD